MKYEKLTRGDYIRLGKAVAQFNRTRNELINMQNRQYMPDEIDYKEVRDLHVTKTELDKYIKNLKNFSEENMEEVIYLSGETLTKWESDILEEEKQIALRRLRGKLGSLGKTHKKERERIESTIKTIKNFEKQVEGDFKDTKERIHRLGARDYNLRRAMQYRKNYMKSLESLSNFKNYDKLIKRLEKINDPLYFYKLIQKSNFLNELFVFYKEPDTIVVGKFESTEEGFNYALEHDFNIKIEE